MAVTIRGKDFKIPTVEVSLQYSVPTGEVGKITFPINPENIQVVTPSEPYIAEIVGQGQVTNPTTEQLKTIVIESLLWGGMKATSELMLSAASKTAKSPLEITNWIEKWQSRKTPAQLVITNISKPINLSVICSEFTSDQRASEEDTIYFSLSLLQYRPFGAKERIINRKKAPKIYKCKKGDTLKKIAKKFSKRGGDDWQLITDIKANKKKLSKNKMKPKKGMKLQMPKVWQT